MSEKLPIVDSVMIQSNSENDTGFRDYKVIGPTWFLSRRRTNNFGDIIYEQSVNQGVSQQALIRLLLKKSSLEAQIYQGLLNTPYEMLINRTTKTIKLKQVKNQENRKHYISIK